MKQQHIIIILALALVGFMVYEGWLSNTQEQDSKSELVDNNAISQAIQQKDTVQLRAYLDGLSKEEKSQFTSTMMEVSSVMDELGALRTNEQVGYAKARIDNAQTQEDFMGGVRTLLRVVSKDSNNIQALEILGEMAIQSGQLQKAKERYQKLLNLQPQNAEYKQKLNSVCEQLGEEC